MAETPASTTGTSHDFDLSSDEEDDILQNLKQQAQRGTRSSASYDPDASSNFGKTTASSDGTPNFESMRDAFREAGMEALETKSPVAAPPTVASADESIRVDFGQAAQRQSLAHQSIASVDGVMLQSRDGGVDAVAEEPQPQTDETSVYSPPGAEEEKAPLATDATSVYSPPGASEAQPTVNTSADEFAALAAAQEDESESEEEEEGDDPEDRQARKYVGSALKPAKKAALERLVEQLQRDNDRLQASLQLAYERAEAAKGEWEAVRSPRFEVLRCLHFIQTRRLQE